MNEKAATEKAVGGGTPVRLRMPPKLLARVDAIVAAQADPKPPRGKVIKQLMREGLRVRRERRKARQQTSGAKG